MHLEIDGEMPILNTDSKGLNTTTTPRVAKGFANLTAYATGTTTCTVKT